MVTGIHRSYLICCILRLSTAIVCHNSQAVRLLIQYEAQVTLPDNRGCFPLHLAAWNGHSDICEELLSSSDARWKINEQVFQIIFYRIS